MTFIFDSFAAMVTELEKKVEDQRVRAESTKTKSKKDELLNNAHGQQQIIWLLKDCYIGKDLRLMDVKAPSTAPGLPEDYMMLTPQEAKTRAKIAEVRKWLDTVEEHLARYDRVDANDCLVAVIANAAEANKQMKGWIHSDPAWGARMQDMQGKAAPKITNSVKEG